MSVETNKNIIPVTITPFKDSGDVNVAGLEQLYAFLSDQGIKEMFVGGSYGAFAVTPIAMRLKFAEHSMKMAQAAGMKSIFNISCGSFEETVQFMKDIAPFKPESVATLIPYYYSGAKFYKLPDIIAYIKEIAKHAPAPLMLYNNPKTTGVDLSASELQTIAEETPITGIKDSNESFEKIMKISTLPLKDASYKARYIPGTTASMLMSGALRFQSCMSGLFMSFPKIISELFEKATQDQFAEATQIYKKVMRAREIMGSLAPRAVSAYTLLNQRGIQVGKPRFPWPRLTPEQEKQLVSELDREELLET